MPLVSLKHALDLAAEQDGFAIGFVCLGWEDAQAYVAAGEVAGAPIILSAGPGARGHMPVEIWGQMFRHLADEASCPVVAHLDHGASAEECLAAIDAGFSSVMFDGSHMPLSENIRITQEVVKAARVAGVGVEAELGVVGYANGEGSEATDPEQVRQFLSVVDVDAFAISVGNVHLQTDQQAEIHWGQAEKIKAISDVPLVIHGGSGIRSEDRTRLARDMNVRKINLGTEFRQEYGRSLRQTLNDFPDLFDRIAISRPSRTALTQMAIDALHAAGWSD